jgi:hypothetical protein
MRTAILLISPLVLAAQDYPRHNFRFGAGAGVPRAQLASFFDPKFGFNVGYGYRFHPNFEADLGLDTVVGAAGVREFVSTQAGFQRIRDFQFLVPLGGRVIIPLASRRLHLFAGGGGAYFRYLERISQPSDYYRIACPFCTARSGWGYYATAGFNVALDRYQRFRFGLAPRVYRGHTDGEPLGALPRFRSRDNWLNLMAEFQIDF